MKYKLLIVSLIIGIAIIGAFYLIEKSNAAKEKQTIIEKIGEYKFVLDAEKDYILEANNDLFVSIPKGAFIDEKGNLITGEIQFEINSEIRFQEKIDMGLFDIYQDKLLSTFKDIVIKASQNGKELHYNPDVPIDVDILTGKNSKLNLFKRNKDKWILKKVSKYLEKYPLMDLDFLPKGFEEAAKQSIPFGNYTKGTIEEVEKIYYSLDLPLPYRVISEGIAPDTLTEIYAHKLGLIRRDTIYMNHFQNERYEPRTELSMRNVEIDSIGVNPRSIQVLKTRRFKNTYIATKEFEERIEWIIKSCEQDILDIYIKNLDSNLYQADELSLNLLVNRNHSQEIVNKFKEFTSLKLTNVKHNSPARKLVQYYSRKLNELNDKLEDNITRRKSEISKKDKQAQKTKQQYNKLLNKRLKYRLKKFGFIPNSNGVYKLAQIVKPLKKFELNVRINNGNKYDRAYVYTIDEQIKSVFALISMDKINYNYVYSSDPILLLKGGQMIKIIGIGYNGDNTAYHLIDCKQQKVMNVDLNLKECKARELKEVFRKISRGYKRENTISVDLKYQKNIYDNFKRKQAQKEEEEIINYLKEFAFPCLKGF